MLDEHFDGQLFGLVAVGAEIGPRPLAQFVPAGRVRNLSDRAEDGPVQLEDLLAEHKLGGKNKPVGFCLLLVQSIPDLTCFKLRAALGNLDIIAVLFLQITVICCIHCNFIKFSSVDFVH